MATCYLHIGMHKTGSSSIQQSLSKDWIGNTEILYAQIDKRSNHSPIFLTLFSAKSARTRKTSKQGINNNKASIFEFFENNKGRDILISGEGLVKLSHQELLQLKTKLSEYFDDIQIIAYIRPPKAYITSAFQQRLKHNPQRLHLNVCYPNYQDRFDKFLKIFGENNVYLWNFKPEKFHNHCVVTDFAQKLGSSINVDNIVRVNDALSKEALVILQIYWWHVAPSIPDKNKVANKLSRLLTVLPGDKIAFDEVTIQMIVDQNRNDIKWMEAALGEDLTEPDKHQPENSVITTDKHLLSTDVETINNFSKLFQERTGNSIGLAKTGLPILPQAIEILLAASTQLSKKRHNTNPRSTSTASPLN